MAAIAVGLALLARMGLDGLLGEEHQPYVTIYIATGLVAWWFGMRAAFFTLGLGVLACLWFIVPPRNTLEVRGLRDVVEILICLLVSVSVVFLLAINQLKEQGRRDSAEASRKLAEAAKKTSSILEQHNVDLERTVRERTASLQNAVRELERFSYALAHDMRGPLRAVHSYTTLLARQCGIQPGSSSADICERITGATERLDSLISDSLDYAKTLREELPLGSVDLGLLIPGLINSYPNLAEHKDRITIIGILPRVLGNQGALTQCFSNLLGNAVKFVQPGQEPRLIIRAESAGEFARIWVQDNGIGIAGEHHERIFQMFEQVNRGFGGTGIGLAIVQAAVQRMGGRVGVESEVGQGSRFWVELKRKEAV